MKGVKDFEEIQAEKTDEISFVKKNKAALRSAC